MVCCKKCNKEISAVENNIYSGYCEKCYEEIEGKKQVSDKNDSYLPNCNKNNIVAKITKSISIIIVIISILVFIVGIATEEIEEMGDVTIIVISLVSSVFIYGYGEIIQLLEDIKNK